MHQKIQMIVIQFSDKTCILFNNNPKTTWTSAIKHYFFEKGTEHDILKIWLSYDSYIITTHPLRQCNMLNIQQYLDEEGYGRTLGKITFIPATPNTIKKIYELRKTVKNGTASRRRV